MFGIGKASSTKSKIPRGILIGLLGFVLLGSAIAVAMPAYADSNLHVKVVPKKSFLHAGKAVFLKGKLMSDIGSEVEKVVVTIDGHTIEFDKNGNVLVSDPAFGDPRTKLKIKDHDDDDPYDVSKQKMKFWVPVKKRVLGAGEYTAMVKVIMANGDVSEDHAHFKILKGPNGKPFSDDNKPNGKPFEGDGPNGKPFQDEDE